MPRTVEQIEDELRAVNKQRDELTQQARSLAEELDQLKYAESAARKLASMQPAERAALAQMLQAGSIESGEAFGKIGD